MSKPKLLGRRRFRVFRVSVTAAALAAIVSFLPITAHAQVLYGSMTGNIADGTGASIPGATVSIKDEQTGLALTAVTDATGTYTIQKHHGGHLHAPREPAGLQGIRPDRHSDDCGQRHPHQRQAGDRRAE